MKETKFKGYFATEDGKIWSSYTNKFLTPNYAGGYGHVTLYIDGKQITASIHKLIAETFIPNPNDLPQINHKDENKQNNAVSNLEWVTANENCNYGTRNEKIAKKAIEWQNPTQIAMCDKKTHDVIKVFDSISEALEYLEVPKRRGGSHISDVLKGTRQSTLGYWWKRI